MYPLLIAGGVAFWMLSAIVVGVLLLAVYDDHWRWSGCVLAIWAGLMTVFGSASSAEWLTWGNAGWFCLAYVPLGLGYMTLRWLLLVSRKRSEFESMLRNYAMRSGFELVDGKIPLEQRVEFTKWWRENRWEHRGVEINMRAWDHRHKITTWAMWWPLSGAIWLLGDLVWDIWQWGVRKLSGSLTALSNWVWPDVSDNFEDDQPLDDPHGVKRTGRMVREAQRIVAESKKK